LFQIRHQPETGSTNDDAARLLGEPGGEGVVLTADYQRAGRGRRARGWIAPAGSSLLFTAILPRTLATADLWAVPFWTALGVAEGIERACGVRVDLQWPNDLLLGGRKCCGILCISRVAGERAWAGCGVGLNVLRPAADDRTLEEISPPPAFLSDHRPAERGAVLDAILAAFTRRLRELDTPGAIAREWEARAGLAGTPYRLLVDGSSEPFEAVAQSIAPDGGLIVIHDGRERTIALADARVLRA
jgi:BirA family biotin operon repressor/biotin-[acetyl-CoA-carboxylase] ligase